MFVHYDYYIGQKVLYMNCYFCTVLELQDGLYLVRPFCDRSIWCKSSDLRAV